MSEIHRNRSSPQCRFAKGKRNLHSVGSQFSFDCTFSAMAALPLHLCGETENGAAEDRAGCRRF